MPTYLYVCDNHGEFEDFHSISFKLDDCPKCVEEGVKSAPPKRLINCASKGVVEMTGDELVAYAKSEGKKLAQEANRNEKTLANLVGEDKFQSNRQALDRFRRG